MASADGLSFQAGGFSGKGVASLLVSSHSQAFLVSEAEKLTLEREITVRVPHSIVTVIKYKG
jgi:hypothetical protein